MGGVEDLDRVLVVVACGYCLSGEVFLQDGNGAIRERREIEDGFLLDAPVLIPVAPAQQL